MSNAPPGWQPDPTGRHEFRYWSGTTWTDEVADAGASATDPIGPSGEQPAVLPGTSGSGEQAVPPGDHPWTAPGGVDSGGQIPSTPGGQGPPFSGAMAPARPPAQGGPSTGLLVGAGIVVLGLVVAIGVLLLSGGGEDEDDDPQAASDTETTDNPSESDTPDTPVSTDTPDTTASVDDLDEDELEDAAPGGMSGQIDSMVTSFQGEIDEDDARCMMREAGAEGIRREIDPTQSFESLPVEDQSAIMFTMLDTCVDAEQVMANLIASGMVETGITQEDADCAATNLVEEIGVEALIDAIAANQYDPLSELSEEDRIAANNAAVDGCAG